MRRVIVESPFKAPTPELRVRNTRYLRLCLRDCLLRGEAPFASHAIYTLDGVLNDDDPANRKLGIEAGFEWHPVAECMVVYTDLLMSEGMKAGVANYIEKANMRVLVRSLTTSPDPKIREEAIEMINADMKRQNVWAVESPDDDFNTYMLPE